MPRKLRTSERRDFTSCRLKWYWAWERSLRQPVPGPALRFGSLVHAALEKRYPPGIQRGPHPAKTFAQLYEIELENAMATFGWRDEDGTWQDAATLGEAMLNEFVKEYGKDAEWEVIASEQTFQVKAGPGLLYVGTWDGVWRNRATGQIMLKEWKTTDAFWDQHLNLDEQASSYWAYAPEWLRKRKILKSDAKLKGILYTFLRKKLPDERPQHPVTGERLNKDGSISKQQPLPLFKRVPVYRDSHDAILLRERVIAQHKEMELVRAGELLPYKAPSRWHCMGCPFQDPCELHEAGADFESVLNGAYVTEDLYAAHEVKHEGKDN
jgi:hypothetical protein